MRRPPRPLVAALALVMALSPLTAEIAAAQSAPASSTPAAPASSAASGSLFERLRASLSATTTKLWNVWGYGSSAAAATVKPPVASVAPLVQTAPVVQTTPVVQTAPVIKPVITPATPLAVPVVEPVVAPVIKPVVSPVVTPVTQVAAPAATVAAPVVKPVVAPSTTVAAPVVKPVVAPVVAPSTPVVAPAVQPVVAPAATVAAPVVKPVVKPVVTPSTPVAGPAVLAPPTSGVTAGASAATAPAGAVAAQTGATGAAAASGAAASGASGATGSAGASAVRATGTAATSAVESAVAAKPVAVGPEGYPVQFGKVSGIAARRLGISNAQAAKATAFLKNSPLFQQLLQPLHPSNIGLAVGATAAMNIWNQVKEGEDVDLSKAMSFVGEKSFWGGVVGSGVGYALVARVAFQFFPAGIGLLPGLGMLFPVFAGMAGSIAGWELGSGLISGKSMKEIFASMDLTQVAGQALGSTVGMLVGAHYGAMLGAIGGPIGAIVGSILLGPVGVSVTKAVVGMFLPGLADGGDVQAAQRETEGVLEKIQKLEKVLGGAPLSQESEAGAAELVDEAVEAELPEEAAASLDLESDPGQVKVRYDEARRKLQEALARNDRVEAQRWLQAMKMAALLYQAALEKGQ